MMAKADAHTAGTTVAFPAESMQHYFLKSRFLDSKDTYFRKALRIHRSSQLAKGPRTRTVHWLKCRLKCRSQRPSRISEFAVLLLSSFCGQQAFNNCF